MNRVPAFEITDPAVITGLIRDLAFAQVVTRGTDGFVASSVPLLLDEPAGGPWRLRGHLARSNPQVRIGDAAVEALALFIGPHAYVSPSTYATKVETGKVVPTWNYVEVHVHGTMRLTDHADRTLSAVRDLTDAHEAHRVDPWGLDDAPDGYVDDLARGIVAFEMDVERVQAKAKLSQNKSEADRIGVIGDLAGGSGRGPEVARLMQASPFVRPHRD